MGYSLRKDQWRYTEWHRRDGKVVARELYDHSGSDVASANVADESENVALVEKMSGLLKPFVKTRWESLGRGKKSRNEQT